MAAGRSSSSYLEDTVAKELFVGPDGNNESEVHVEKTLSASSDALRDAQRTECEGGDSLGIPAKFLPQPSLMPVEVKNEPAMIPRGILWTGRPPIASCDELVAGTSCAPSNGENSSSRTASPPNSSSCAAGTLVANRRPNGNASELTRRLHTALLEYARLDAEVLAVGEPQSNAPPGAGGLGPRGPDSLRKEYDKLEADIERLVARQKISSERAALLEALLRRREARVVELESQLAKRDPSSASGPPTTAPGTPSTVAATTAPAVSVAQWRQKAAMLEEELRAKAEIVTRLRQRELWFEQQLRRQSEANDSPLRALLDELQGLQQGVACLPRSPTGKTRGNAGQIDSAKRCVNGSSKSVGSAQDPLPTDDSASAAATSSQGSPNLLQRATAVSESPGAAAMHAEMEQLARRIDLVSSAGSRYSFDPRFALAAPDTYQATALTSAPAAGSIVPALPQEQLPLHMQMSNDAPDQQQQRANTAWTQECVENLPGLQGQRRTTPGDASEQQHYANMGMSSNLGQVTAAQQLHSGRGITLPNGYRRHPLNDTRDAALEDILHWQAQAQAQVQMQAPDQGQALANQQALIMQGHLPSAPTDVPLGYQVLSNEVHVV